MRRFVMISALLLAAAASAVAQVPDSRPESRPGSRPVIGDQRDGGGEPTSRPRGGRRRPGGGQPIGAESRAARDLAQSETRPDSRAESKPAESPFIAFVNGTIHQVSGPVIRQGTVLVKDDKIIQVGRNVQIPDGARIVDVNDKHVAPGFVALRSSGTFGGGFAPRGEQEKLSDQADPFSQSMLMAVAHGITTACEGGNGSPVGQVGGFIGKHAYGSVDGMYLRDPAAVFLTYGQGSISDRMQTRDILKKAVEYRQKRNAYVAEVMGGKKDAKAPTGDEGAKLFLRVMDGELPCFVNASTGPELQAIADLATEFELPMVVLDGREAWTMTDRLARAPLSFILSPRVRGPAGPAGNEARDFTEKPSGWSITNAAVLERAGIPWGIQALSGFVGTGGLPGRDLMQLNMDAAFAIRGGASDAMALRAITLSAAEILKIQDRVGSLSPGKDADIVVFDLEPLDYRAFAERVYVNGKLVYEKDKVSLFNHIQTDRSKGLKGQWWNERLDQK